MEQTKVTFFRSTTGDIEATAFLPNDRQVRIEKLVGDAVSSLKNTKGLDAQPALDSYNARFQSIDGKKSLVLTLRSSGSTYQPSQGFQEAPERKFPELATSRAAAAGKPPSSAIQQPSFSFSSSSSSAFGSGSSASRVISSVEASRAAAAGKPPFSAIQQSSFPSSSSSSSASSSGSASSSQPPFTQSVRAQPTTSCFHPPNKATNPILTTFASLYQNAKTKPIKEALFSWLLHYQHYNADLTQSEMDQFGYPYPLYKMQPKPGYVRTSPHLYHLIFPFINKHLAHFFGEDPEPYVDLSSPVACDVLAMFFPQKKPEIIHVTLKDLSDTGLNILKRQKNNKGPFLFVLQDPGIDCALMWGAQFDDQGKPVWTDLENIYGKDVSSILGKAGATADRLAVNQFMAVNQFKNPDLGAICYLLKKEMPKAVPKIPQDLSFIWDDKIKEMGGYSLDPSMEIYRDAILRWHSSYFANYPTDFAWPLLCTEVLPWISESNDLTKWVKAYQNLCEVVMLTLAASPKVCKDKNLNFKSRYLELLDPKNELENLTKGAGLFPYAMSSNFFVLQHLLSHMGKKPPQVISISQNYFETLQLLEKTKGIQYTRKDSLDEIKSLPDILFVDIHPNNAAKEELFQNDIGSWIENQLKSDPSKKLSLVLDLTLNRLSDPVVQKTLQQLNPFIERGQLEVFILQSLAKLVQLGADNFSGGACIYLGPPKSTPPKFPEPLPEKGAFFSLLCSQFQDLIDPYFQQVRENTQWVYRNLQERFGRISDCPAKITLNVDEGTVYVAINFAPLLQRCASHKSSVEDLKNSFLEIAAQRKIPITGRQSFGFPLSNMTVAADSIRFSIGVQDKAILKEQIDLIADLIQMLAISTGGTKSSFDSVVFSKRVKEAVTIVNGEQELKPIPVRVRSTHGTDAKANIGFNSEGPYIEILEKGESSLYEAAVVDAFKISRYDWSQSDLLQLCFHLLCQSGKPFVQVDEERETPSYGIGGVLKEFPLLKLDLLPPIKLEEAKDSSSGRIPVSEASVQALSDKEELDHENTFAIGEGLGQVPVSLWQLDSKRRREILTKCHTHDYQRKKHPDPDKPNCGILEFGQKKPFLDYKKSIFDAFVKKKLEGVIEFLNGLDFKNLPIPHDYFLEYRVIKTPHPLYAELNLLGANLTHQLDNNILEMICQIRDKKCQNTIFDAMFDHILKGEIKPLGKKSAAILKKLGPNYSIHNPDFLNDWIEKFHKYTDANPKEIPNVFSYVSALFPFILKKYNSRISLLQNINTASCLKKIAEKIEIYDPALKNHMLKLEAELVQGKIGRITAFLKLYTTYPLSPDNREELLGRISKMDEEKILSWFGSGDFICELDQQEINRLTEIDDLDEYEVFKSRDQKAMTEFFKAGAFQKVLLDCLAKNPPSHVFQAFTWAIITQDDKLFSALYSICSSKAFPQEDFEDLARFQAHFDLSNPIQKKLAHLLNQKGP